MQSWQANAEQRQALEQQVAFPLTPLRYGLFTPESQWQPRGERRISQGWRQAAELREGLGRAQQSNREAQLEAIKTSSARVFRLGVGHCLSGLSGEFD